MLGFKGERQSGSPNAEGASGAQLGMETHELVARRLDALRREGLEIGKQVGGGETSLAYDCHSGENEIPELVKVSMMDSGIGEPEISSLKSLGGIPGVPRLLKIYTEKEIAIAILVEKITGSSLRDRIKTPAEGLADIFLKMRAFVEEFHKRGYLMPRDWLKEDNWIVKEDGQPYLVDLGESQRAPQSMEEADFALKGDLRTFRSLIERYIEDMNKKDRKALQNLMYRDLVLGK